MPSDSLYELIFSTKFKQNGKRSANWVQVEAAIGAALFACKSLDGAAAGQRV